MKSSQNNSNQVAIIKNKYPLKKYKKTSSEAGFII